MTPPLTVFTFKYLCQQSVNIQGFLILADQETL